MNIIFSRHKTPPGLRGRAAGVGHAARGGVHSPLFKGISLFLLAGILTLGLAVADFARRMVSTFNPGRGTDLGVVFTGQFVRTDIGLRLLEDGQIKRLFISGVNIGAGMPPQNFVRQFKLSPALIQALGDGQLSLGENGQDTLQNALETRCWLARFPSDQPVVLITSRWHMPRASIVLERTVRGNRIERYNVDDGLMSADRLLDEFAKYLATRAISFWWLIAGKPNFEC